VATHQQGGTLDEIYTDLKVIKGDVIQVNSSDHHMINVDLIWEYEKD
jgi:hypothetical protein